MMKACFFFFFFLPLLMACNGQSPEPPKAITQKDTMLPITASFTSTDNIKNIHIKNASIDTLKYYIGMEIWVDSSWQEAITDIHPNAPKMANLVLTLLPKADTTNRCDLTKSIPSFYKSDTARYRFKISYGKTTDSIGPYITTEEFRLK